MEQRFLTWTWPSHPRQPHTARRFFEQLFLDIQSVHALLSWNKDFCLGHGLLILDSRIQLEDSSSNSSSTVKVFTRLFMQTRAICPLTYIAAAKYSFSKFEFRPCMATASTQKTSVCHRLAWRQRILMSTLSRFATRSTWSGENDESLETSLTGWRVCFCCICGVSLVAISSTIATEKASWKLRSSLSFFAGRWITNATHQLVSKWIERPIWGHVYGKRQTLVCTTWPSFPLAYASLFITSTP